MEIEEFKNAKADLELKFKKEKDALAISYALSNNPYKIGDILQRKEAYIIKIDKITVDINSYGIPGCVYHGPELKKDLTPKKNGNRESIWQSNKYYEKIG